MNQNHLEVDSYADGAIEFAIDKAILLLDNTKELPTFSFLIQNDHCYTEVVPNKSDFHFDETLIVDSFKDFGNEKLEENAVAGYCIVNTILTQLHEQPTKAIAVFIKMKNDYLSLKSRQYYFPYALIDGKPVIDFESSFSSEA